MSIGSRQMGGLLQVGLGRVLGFLEQIQP